MKLSATYTICYTQLLQVGLLCIIFAHCQNPQFTSVDVYETSAKGNKLTLVRDFKPAEKSVHININTHVRLQRIEGFGGSFTEASAYALSQLSKTNRMKILEAYFSPSGANYSLTRTHMASCDFSLSNYTYAKVPNDTNLQYFSIEEDRADLI
ncbi:MAG: glycosyl hydrolase family 30, partial [Bacteroidota bacterium]